MVQIGKTLQAKHLETLSPWFKEFAATAGTTALPLLPRHLAEFPTRWPFPRGDLYHWIVLLNRFDLILELFIKTYELKDGPQKVEFGRKVLESTKKTTPDALELLHGESSETHDLNDLDFGKDGDRQLIESILNFSRMLLENCGNRSLYGSSSYLDSLLNTTSLSLLESTLLLSSQLAQRYSTAAKRGPARLNQAVLNSHYSIDLDKVQQLAQPFSKTVVIPAEPAQPTTPVTPSAKGKEKAYFSTPALGQKGSTTTVYANDIVSLAKGGVINTSGPKTMRSRGTKASVQASNAGWETWGDVRLSYYPKISAESEANNTPRPSAIAPSNNVPTTPTPIRRASNLGPHGQRTNRISSVDESPAPASRLNSNADDAPTSTVKTVEISASEIKAVGLHALLRKYCAGLPSEQQYELLTKLRAANALTTSLETRRHLLSVRLLAITNMAYIHSESAFAENILKQDSDEPRRLQLVPQLAELIHPPAESEDAVPRHLQTLALSTLTAIAVQHTGGAKFQDVCSALNANVNHGVLLYVIRKAVAEMSDNESVDEIEQDEWRDALFELIFNIALVPRTATDLVTAGVIPIFVEVLSLRNPVAERYYPKIVSFLDNLVYSVREAFQVLVDAGGLDVVSSLVVNQVKTASKLAESSEGIQPEYKSPSLDYEIRYYQQQTLKWVFKFIHHMMASSGAHGGNSERLLRNLVDSSQLLGSLKQVIQNSRVFGSVVWTNAIMILNDFINNEPTSFTIILEAGLSKAVLEAVTGKAITMPPDIKVKEPEEEQNHDASSPASSEDAPTVNVDTTPHPPTQEALQIPRSGPLAQGIMPSTDAILILPQAFNAMCLSADGMKLFLASKALDSFFEIFESPEHVKCLSSNMFSNSSSSVTSQLGASFDELVRHHPKLKTFIVNAVLDMVARVAYLCKTTAEGGKIGARLLAHLPTTADAKGKGKAVEEATDVEMMDIDSEPEGISPLAQAETPDKNSMTPYIAVVAQFLHTLFSNTSVATEFSTRGGVEYLLDFADSPCLPCAFVQSQITNSTSNTLNICIAELADKKPHLVVPSLLKRAQVAADTIAPFAKKSGNESFFKQFVIPKDLDAVTRDQCAQGTKIVKALVAIDSVVTILQRALKSDYGVPRSVTTNFHTLNFNDYYARLVRSLGDLLGASVSEGLLLEQIIPQHWNEKEDRPSTGPSLEAVPETEPASPAAPVVDIVAVENEQTGALDGASKPTSQAKKKMTKEEKDSLHYKNYQTLKYLLGHMSKAISPFFQTLGKVLISKRNQGAFQRQSQTEIAVALAETLLHLLNDQPQERSVGQLKYWHAILKVLSKTLVDHTGHPDRPAVQTITLVLQAFKDRGGFDTVNRIIEVCSKDIESSTNDEDPIRSTSVEILNHVLPVYTHVVSGRAVTEAAQSALLGSGRQVADKAKSDYFSPQQFLVELRMAVFPAIRHLWEASPVDKTPSSTWSTLIAVIRAIAQADHELGANKRSEKIGPTVQASREYFKPNGDHLISLLDDAGGDEEIVKEALYRCANNLAAAREYIKDMRADRNSGRNPIPPSDIAAEVPSTPRPRTSTSAATATPDFNDQEMEINSLPELDLNHPTTSDQQAERERIVQSFAASQQTPIAPEDPKIKRVTVEDLDEERSSIRENLVDRCLEIIYRHGEVTFDVADLLTTFVGKVHDQMDFRREIGTSVMAVLQSYETLEDISDKGKEVAAAAHLLGLMLQEKPFYEATVDLLRESIPTMLTYIKLSPSHSAKNPSPWISQVLLIIETLLRTDERPRKTRFKMPKSEQDTVDTPVLEKRDFTISREERLQLLESILEILPRVGMAKDEVLALAVLRILVILTRDRPVAQNMGEKKNIQRLFAMAKQLAGSSSARIHGQLMLILRHIIEDEETIKQIMRSEIKAVFESHRHPRNVDVTNYLRTLSAQALRAPELFVEVTNEMVKFGRWTYPASDVPSRPNYLVLKEVESTEKSVDDSVQPTVQATEDLSIQDVKPSTEGEDSEMGEASKLPAPEQKAPAVENPDGVVHFLLCELLNYRDVEDLDPSIAANATAEKTAAAIGTTTDTDMSGTSTTDIPLKKDEKSSKVPGKQDFKSEEHPIYIYRCFILQCLTELLSSYNRTKIEFINFKRSAPQLAMTPSKPRSSVINYLLSDLIPVGTLEHAETTALRKRFTTSSWADSVLTALLSKTGEQSVDKARELSDGDDEPDLQFVRRFVLENILRAFKEASASSEPLEIKYARMLSLADLMGHIMSGKGIEDRHSHDALTSRNHAQLRRLMFEKGYIAALTSSIAEIDLNFPNAKRAVKYILRPLKTLTHTAQTLSELGLISTHPADGDVDDIEYATSVSDLDDDREETPDLFRNSTLGMFEAGGEEESSSSDDDDEEMYEGEYDEEGMDYDEEMEEDDEDNISDEDEDFEGMGPIEGLDGDHAMDIEVTMDEAEDIESAGSEEEDDDDDDDEDEEDSEDDDARVEIIDELGNVHDAGDEDDEAEEWESDDDEEDYEGQAADQEEARAHMDDMQNSPLGHLVRALGGDDHEGAVEILQRMEDEGLDEGEQIGEYLEDVEDEDEEDEEDDMADEEMLFDSFPDGPPPFAWDEADAPMVIGHRRPRGLQALPIFHGGPRDPLGVPDYRSTYRSHRPGQPPRSADDGTNPLLQRANSSGTSSHAAARAYPGGWVAPAGLDLLDIGLGGRHSYGESPAALLNDLIRTLPMPGTITRGGQALQFHITGHGEMPRDLQAMFGIARGSRFEHRRDTVDPGSATSFNPQSTTARWTEEAKILFGSQHHEVTADITMALNAVLVPPAIEADKAFKAAEAERIRKAEEEAKKRAEEERIAKEAKEAEERIAREKKEAEEREAAEKAAAESAAARGIESDHNESGEPVVTETETDAMDTASDAGPSGDGEEAPASDRPRVTTQIRGQSFDITDLGIDADFLAELPEELREEVIMSAVAERRSQAAATGAQPSDIDQDFLDALPDDIRDEIIQQERQDRRRRERDEQRRQAAANGGRDPALDMDPASILATLPPALRQQVLMEQDEDMINQLPPDLAAQARAFQREDRIHQGRVPMAARRTGGPAVPEATGQRPVRRPVVQMLDKPGVATLLRLMFVLQQGTLRSALNSVLQYVSNNKQNRSDVISTLLHILQDGSADMSAVERSFAQLSLKAKQPKDKDPKTPTTLKRTLTSTSTSGVLSAPAAQINSEASPLMVVQQCLHVLTHLSQFNPHVPSFFLTEHGNVAAGLKRTLSRKGKGKESEAAKYALNSLLCLLDRDLIMESSTVMESLSALLNMTTQPLQTLDRKQKEAAEDAKKARENATADSQAVTGEPVAQSAEITQTSESVSGATASAEGSAQPDESAVNTETSPAVETAKDTDKKVRPFTPPVVPDYNLKLVINIFVARECSRKTFQETISTIKNLSVIPGAKSVFGRELITKAQELGEIILGDLQQLLPQIQKATTSTEIQGLALAKFSPTSSDQNKLLRVLTALDHLFDPKLNKDKNAGQDDGESAEKQDLLSSLYENSTFGPMWGKLSACLSAIRQREHMLNVATILLPLIESLMVVCKNTTLKDAPISRSQLGKEMMLTSPPPESRMESLFFTFTEEHRKILNDLVRQNPKLMSGTFSLLVKNPKVLEFDNKRNYFGRSIRERNPQARQSYPPLQLSVRRDQVFHDSFKSLYFQTGDQMKYGKLSIRFHGEEGVDAGGVTREWFQVLSRQMFEPGYALFIPVSSDRTTFHPNQLSSINEEHLMFFKFIGRIIGKALYENRVLDCHFSRAVYKAILGKQISLKDMESLDPEYYKSLVWMLENDITDIITETFSVDNDKFGVIETIDFIPNGRNTPVTEENKHEYVRLMVEFKLTGSVKAQLDEFLKGFHEIIPAELVAIFNEQELELLISGLPEIDVDDWKSNTEYHNYSGASPQIQWFWRAVRSYDKEERAKLLQFVTGTSKVPLNGFKELEGMNGFSRFNIHRDYGNKDRLPSSHTCFNQLDLPEYESYDVLRQQVLTAITAGSEYFGFA